MAATNTSCTGTNFCGLLIILFVALKLTHYIDWSWIWVLSPLWVGFVALFVLFLVLSLFEGLTGT